MQRAGHALHAVRLWRMPQVNGGPLQVLLAGAAHPVHLWSGFQTEDEAMSDLIQSYIETLTPKVTGTLRGTAKLVITGEGAVMLDETGARACDAGDPADVALIASDAVFRAILSGDQNPVMAVMGGKLKIDGSAQRALKVSEILVG